VVELEGDMRKLIKPMTKGATNCRPSAVPDLGEHVAAVVRNCRLDLKLTQGQLAKRLAGTLPEGTVSQSYVSQIENQQRPISLHLLSVLALALETTASSIVSRAEKRLRRTAIHAKTLTIPGA